MFRTTALNNSRLTEAAVTRALVQSEGQGRFCRGRMSSSQVVGEAGDSFGTAAQSAHAAGSGVWSLPANCLRHFCAMFCTRHDLPEKIKSYLRENS